MATSKKRSFDPQQQQIGAVYAKSLLAAARESGNIEEVSIPVYSDLLSSL